MEAQDEGVAVPYIVRGASTKDRRKSRWIEQRWLVVLASWLQHFCVLGTVYSSGLYIVPMATTFDTGRGESAWVGSIWFGTAILSTFPASLATNHFGLRLPAFLAALVAGVGLAASGAALRIWVVYLVGVLVGLGLSTLSTASVMVQAWFPKNRGRATGIAMTGSGLGNFVYALAIQFIINDNEPSGCPAPRNECDGWRPALWYQAAWTSGLLVIASIMAYRAPPVAPQYRQSITGVRLLMSDPPMVINPETGQPQHAVHISNKTLLGTPCLRALALFWFFVGLGFQNVFSHFAAHAEDSGVSKWSAAVLLSLMGIASIFGRLLLGLAADRFKRTHVLAATCFALALTAAVWPSVTSFGGLVSIALLYGFLSGGVPSLPPTIAADYYAERFPKRLYTLYASTFVCQLPTVMLGPPTCGWMYDAEGDYVAAGLFSAVGITLAGLCVLTIPSIDVHNNFLDAIEDAALGDVVKVTSDDAPDSEAISPNTGAQRPQGVGGQGIDGLLLSSAHSVRTSQV